MIKNVVFPQELYHEYHTHRIPCLVLLDGVTIQEFLIILLVKTLKNNPDLFVNFYLPFPSHIGFMMGKPVIGFSDTEKATLNQLITNPFTDILAECRLGSLVCNSNSVLEAWEGAIRGGGV